MRNISNKLEDVLRQKKRLSRWIRDNGEKIIRMLRDIEENLYQDKIETTQDEINTQESD